MSKRPVYLTASLSFSSFCCVWYGCCYLKGLNTLFVAKSVGTSFGSVSGLDFESSVLGSHLTTRIALYLLRKWLLKLYYAKKALMKSLKVMRAYCSSSYRVTDFNSPNNRNTYKFNSCTYVLDVILSHLEASLSYSWCCRNSAYRALLAEKRRLTLLDWLDVKSESWVFGR